jgi:hypothetical protein
VRVAPSGFCLRFLGTTALALIAVGCASRPAPAPVVRPVIVKPIPGTDTIPIPLDELGARTYHGLAGGLYPRGANVPAADYDAAGIAGRNAIRPLAVNGIPSGAGRYVLLSVGGGNASAAWCSVSSAPPCDSGSFTGRAAADTSVNHGALVIVNGAIPGAGFEEWSNPTSKNYTRIRDTRLAPLGLSENQVQAIWMSIADSGAAFPLTASSADAAPRLQRLGATIRALKTRFPNLQLLFISSGVYGGYSPDGEPASYESGFIVRWLIESQNVAKSAPLVGWGPYFWSRGSQPRADGLAWLRSDFDSTGAVFSQSGQSKAGSRLFDFFQNSPYTRCWFIAGPVCG